MNLYDFLNIKDGFIKINSQELSVITLIKAFNAIESMGEQVTEIIIHPDKLIELQNKAKLDIFEGKNIYKKIIQEKSIFGAQIIVDNNQPSQIIQFNNSKKNPEKSVKLFVEN